MDLSIHRYPDGLPSINVIRLTLYWKGHFYRCEYTMGDNVYTVYGVELSGKLVQIHQGIKKIDTLSEIGLFFQECLTFLK